VQSKISIPTLSSDSVIDSETDILLTVEQGSVTWVSDSALPILGHTADELVGARFDALFFLTEEKNSASDNLVSGAQRGWHDMFGRLKGGSVERFRVSFLGQLPDGAIGVLARIDRTASMRAKLDDMRLRVRTIFNSIPVGLLIVTPDGKLEAVNPAMARLLERKEREFFSSSLNLIFKNDAVLQLQQFLTDSATREQFELLELEAVTATKELVLVDAVGKMFQSEGQTKAILAITDATDRIRLEQLRQDLIGMVSHDLRAPLASVDSFLQLITSGEYGTLTELGNEKMAQARARIATLNDMVRDLLDMARFDSGTIKLQLAEFSCSGLIAESIAAISELAAGKNIHILVSDCKITVTGDFERLSQVMVNLLANAVHYSPSGSEVRVWAENQDSDTLQISVQDQGPGIKPEEREFVFEKFHRLARSGGSNVGGSGLGLAICKQLVEMHGGAIGCTEAQTGGGTIFWLRLPSSIKPVAKTPDRCD
jgi:signal transduction histidine kinase